MRFPMLTRAFVPASLLALAACGSSTTSPGTFDAAAMNQSIQAAGAGFDAAPVASFGASGARIDAALGTPLIGPTSPTSAMLRPATALTPSLVRAANRLALQPRVTPGTNAFAIPSVALGKTFEWNTGTTAYAATTRTGAPTNGVRFILYTMDTVTSQPVLPLAEVGYADVTQTAGGSSLALRVVVVASTVTYLDYTAALSGTVSAPTYTVSGFVTDGTDQANFTLGNAFTASNTGGSLNVDWTIAVPTKTVNFTLGAGIVVSGLASTFDVTSQITGPAGNVGLTGAFTSAAGGTLGVQVNGAPFATVAVAAGGESVTATSASGTALTPVETNVVLAIFGLFKTAIEAAGDLLAPLGA